MIIGLSSASALLLFLLNFIVKAGAAPAPDAHNDPCAIIGGQQWVSPSAVRACFQSIPVNETIKNNIIEVINKTLAFHTSVSYEALAPEPFTLDVHEDILGDLARISRQSYASDFDLHVDISRSVKRLDDGHCVYTNACYDSLFVSVLPIPLVHLTDAHGTQTVNIAPEAFDVSSSQFASQIPIWQNALPAQLKLESLSGAEVLSINGQDPYVAVDANAAITGSFQGFGTRQNSFFASYQRVDTGWSYVLGNFAQQSLPLTDSVTLTVQLVNSTKVETITLPYRSQFGSTSVNFTDSKSFWENNCLATNSTNGMDAYATNSSSANIESSNSPQSQKTTIRQQPGGRFPPMPLISPNSLTNQGHLLSAILTDGPAFSDITLPPGLTPPAPISGTGVTQFYMLKDGKTGVLALGSFEEAEIDPFQNTLLVGLQALVAQGATQLIADVTNNGGGFICIAHWLHRIIAGPKNTTVPQAGLYTKARAGPLAQLIVKNIVAGADPDNLLLFNSLNWEFANNTPFPAEYDWLQPPVDLVINGRPDSFSQRLGQECQPFSQTPPDTALFDTEKVAIVSNGRCASSCSLFSVTMAKEEGAKTVVVGGRSDVQQQYCGTVGGQSTDYFTIDTEIKTTHLKENPLAPPNFLTNSVQGLTFRLGFGIFDTQQPEEWQDRPASVNFPLTPQTLNSSLQSGKLKALGTSEFVPTGRVLIMRLRLGNPKKPSIEARKVIMRVFCDSINECGPSGKGLSTHDIFHLAAQRHQRDSEQYILWKSQRGERRRLQREKKMMLIAEGGNSTQESTSILGSLFSQFGDKKPEEQNTEEKTIMQSTTNTLEESQTLSETTNANFDSANPSYRMAVPEKNPVVSISLLKNSLLHYYEQRGFIKKINYLEKIEQTKKLKQGKGKSKGGSSKPIVTVVEQRVWRWRLTDEGVIKGQTIAAL